MGKLRNLYNRAVGKMGIRKKPGMAVINEGLMKERDPKFDTFFYQLHNDVDEETLNGLLTGGRFSEVGDGGVSPILLWCMRQENERVMRAASIALSELNDESSIQELTEMAKEDGLRSKLALGNLGKLKARSALPEIMEIYKNTGNTAALRAIGEIGDTAATGLLVSRLRGSPDYEDRLVFDTLGILGDEAAAPEIEKFANHENDEVRAAAIGALAKIGSKFSVPALIKALSDSDTGIRACAAEGLGNIGDKSAVPALIDGFQKYGNSEGRIDQTDDPRGIMVWALGKIGDSSAIDPLFSGADEDPDEYVRAECVRALGRIGGIEASYFIERLTHPSRAMQDAAESAVRKIDCVPDLYCGFLTSESYETRQAIVGLLKQIIFDSRSLEKIQEILFYLDAGIEMAARLERAEDMSANELQFRSEAIYRLAKEREAEYSERDLKRREEIGKSIARKRSAEAEEKLRREEDSDY